MDSDRIAQPFHAGELRAQELAGGGPAGAGVRNYMPDQHREFFQLLPFLCLAVADAEGWPLASLVQGLPGFVTAPTPNALAIGALPDAGDPVRAALVPGRPTGVLGIDLATRRRNRANGTLALVDAKGMVLDVRQTFGNCPKYIRVRQLERVDATPGEVLCFDGLPPAAASMVQTSETMFVATSSGGAGGAQGGLDISHRGGAAGFVRVEGDSLLVPDYPGNRYFNTLGNLLLEPRCALVLVDFSSGDVLQLQGSAEVLWDCVPEGDALAQRMWHLRVRRGWLRRAAFALRA
jgi:uncharacterized protein